ncbi:MAG: methyltransferase domain-containing protein [Gemmatimonadetes bacterium]|nr:methyltransferase domain-containing protein [Gemmatimonadota bacterium]
MQVTPIVKGLASYVPGMHSRRSKRRNMRSATAAYCYEVWLKHLTILDEHSGARLPDAVAELGPGGSLGLGIAALLSGASTYYALDIVEYSEDDLNLRLLDEMVDLFRQRKVTEVGWPVNRDLSISQVLSDDILEDALAPERVESIRAALRSPDGHADGITIRYIVPWNDPAVLRAGEVDMIVSQAVLEHVDELVDTYDAFARWLKPGGLMSHEIDFRCHGLTKQWNGHWEYPELAWRMIVGNKPYLINREPCSTHVRMMQERGFEVTCELRQHMQGIGRGQLSRRWQGMTDEDLISGTAVLQARLG